MEQFNCLIIWQINWNSLKDDYFLTHVSFEPQNEPVMNWVFQDISFIFIYLYIFVIYQHVAYNGHITLISRTNPPAYLCAPAGSCNWDDVRATQTRPLIYRDTLRQGQAKQMWHTDTVVILRGQAEEFPRDYTAVRDGVQKSGMWSWVRVEGQRSKCRQGGLCKSIK